MIYIKKDWNHLVATLSGLSFGKKAIILTDNIVEGLYYNEIEAILHPIFPYLSKFVIPNGESAKNINVLAEILTAFFDAGLDRSSVVVALGGGVVSDVAGFAASVYMRGISYINLPTTFLSQADSSIGGKTGIDFCGTKNLVGTFFKPALIYSNVATLTDLPKEQYISGLAEVIKYGIIKDCSMFDFIFDNRHKIANRDTHVLKSILAKCASIKSAIVAEDERDNGTRQVLNYGHTFGHAIEDLCKYEMPHGFCIALGMMCAAAFSRNMGRMSVADANKIHDMLNFFGLPTKLPGKYYINAFDIVNKMRNDKKAKNGEITLIISHKIGSAEIICGAEKDTVLAAINEIY